ncbi:MAG: InlB B-repeat-containing protein, partial [Firmicutes bacterium]|nr:InlB B-repeat-containing protein [Bacillota bacterium]
MRNKRIYLFMALLFVLAMVVPFGAGTAFADVPTALSVPTIPDGGQPAQLGAVLFHFTAGQLRDGDSCTVSLPQNFQFLKAGGVEDWVMSPADWSWQWNGSVGEQVYGQANGNYFSIPATAPNSTDANGLAGASLTISSLSDNQIKITIFGTPATGSDGYLYLYLNNIYVDSGYIGFIPLTISAPNAPNGSGFTSGTVNVGRVTSIGLVNIECTNAPVFSDQGTVTLNIEEDLPGSLKSGESLKLTLPDGFAWGSGATLPAGAVTLLRGGAADPNFTSTGGTGSGLTDPNTLANYLQNHFTISGSNSNQLILNLPAGFQSTAPLAFQVEVPIRVYDNTVIRAGNVIATVTGESTCTVNAVSVGQYTAAYITSLYSPSVLAGTNTSLGAVFMQFAPGQLSDGDSCLISLPQNFEFDRIDGSNAMPKGNVMTDADWAYHRPNGSFSTYYGQMPYYGGSFTVYSNYFVIPDYNQSVSDYNGLKDAGLNITQISKNQIKVTVVGSPNPAYNCYVYLYLGNIYVDSGYGGNAPLTVSPFSGRGFINGTVKVGNVYSSGLVNIESVNAPVFSEQGMVTLRIGEVVPSSFKAGESLKLTLPDGFTWAFGPSFPDGALIVLWGSAVDSNSDSAGGGQISNLAGYTLANYLQDHFIVSGANFNQLILNLPAGFRSTNAIAFEIKVPIQVDDHALAQAGTVNATVSGVGSYNVNTIPVGQYRPLLMITPASNTFANATAGYNNSAMSQIFTITNTGAMEITGLTASINGNFEISTGLSATSIAPGGTVTLSVRPVSGLAAQTTPYAGRLYVTSSYGIGNSASLSFTVKAASIVVGGGGGGGGSSNYTVTFATAGGSTVNSQKLANGAKVTKPADPTKDGFTFAGWYSDKALTTAYDFTKGITGNVTIYAKWTANTAPLTPKPTPTPGPAPTPGPGPGTGQPSSSSGWQNPFSDVKSTDWFYGDVSYAVANGIFNGTGATTFSPNDSV